MTAFLSPAIPSIKSSSLRVVLGIPNTLSFEDSVCGTSSVLNVQANHIGVETEFNILSHEGKMEPDMEATAVIGTRWQPRDWVEDLNTFTRPALTTSWWKRGPSWEEQRLQTRTPENHQETKEAKLSQSLEETWFPQEWDLRDGHRTRTGESIGRKFWHGA